MPNLGSGLILCIFLYSATGLAGELQQVILHDGSVINAEVVSLKNGVYRLSSPTLGELEVRASRIRSIQAMSGDTGSAAQARQTSPSGQQAELERIQNNLLSNKDTVAIIMSLQNDPDVQAILNDREIMAAMQSGNYEALANNPKMKNLMNKPEIKQITKGVSP